MTKFSYLSKSQPKKVVSRKKIIPSLGTKSLNIIIGSLILVFGLSYLIQVNGLATKGYQITELEQKISKLEQDKSDLELDILSLQSMGSVKDKVESLGMVVVGETDYLAVTPVAVAR